MPQINKHKSIKHVKKKKTFIRNFHKKKKKKKKKKIERILFDRKSEYDNHLLP